MTVQTEHRRQNNKNKVDFTGEVIYIGIDAHGRSFEITIYYNGYEYKTFTQDPEPYKLVRYLNKHFPGAGYNSVYEAGYCGYWIHDKLTILGVENIVVNAADVPLKDKEKKNKTDKVDSRRLARGLMNGDLSAIYIPTDKQREDRTLVRSRYSFVQKQTRVKNQIKSFLAFYGIHITEEEGAKHWSNNYIRWLESLSIKHESSKKALEMYLSELRHIKQIIAEITRSIRLLGETYEYKKQVELLTTVPGIGILTAMILLTEIADIKRFNKFDHLCSYIGLVPTEHSSGEHISRGDITPRRNRFLRHILIESSWVAVRKDPALMLANRKYRSNGKNGPKAIIKVARKLVSRIYQVLKNQRPYQLGIAN